uniref:Uncharacterized protein n=1 Tax=Avena sativa TaxID=4498 RepID=A0ACD5U8Q9_AVESA
MTNMKHTKICSRIAAQRAASPNLNKLYITKESSCAEPVDQLFVDTAVYSRNRCFRLAFSSNSGKKSFLMATGRFKCKNMNDQELFMESLICRLDDDCHKLLTCKLDLECKKILHFHSEASVPRIQGRNYPDAIDTYRSTFPQEYTYGRSPFPALDGFIESIASFGNVSGGIRPGWSNQPGLKVWPQPRGVARTFSPGWWLQPGRILLPSINATSQPPLPPLCFFEWWKV